MVHGAAKNWTRLMGEGNGTPLQYSCLENPMDRGAWQAAVHGVTNSRTRLIDFTFTFTFMHWRRKWQSTPVFLPGESQGRGSLLGCRLWGRTESDTTEVTQQQQQSDLTCSQTRQKAHFILLPYLEADGPGLDFFVCIVKLITTVPASQALVMTVIISILTVTLTFNGEWIGHKCEGQKQVLRSETELNCQQDRVYTTFCPGILVIC